MGGQGWRGRRRVLCCALLACGLGLAVPAAAQASIGAGDVSVSEGNGGVSAIFTITRSAGLLAAPVTVAFTTAAGSAGSADYVTTSGTRDFPGSLLGGTQVAQVAVPIVGDRLDEPDEAFRLVLTGPEVTDAVATATILDDDPPPSIAVADAPAATEGATATFAIALSAPSGRDVSVAFATADGTAVAGQDFTARSGTLTIPAGATTAAVGVPLIDDSADEPSEGFGLRLSAPVNATLGDAAATATILDNDVPPSAAAPPPAPAAPPAPTPPSTTAGSGAGGSGSAATPSSVVESLGLGSPRLGRPDTAVVTIACPQGAGRCTGQVTLFSRANKRSQIKDLRSERRLGRRTYALAAGRTVTLSFALSRADRRLLERAGRIKVRAYALTKDGSGRSGVRTANGTLVRRTAHSSPTKR